MSDGESESIKIISPGLATTGLQPGSVLDGRYEIQTYLGKGGMCSVYKARDLQLQREVAVKLLHGHLIVDAAAIERFRREAVTVCTLEHPNIVRVYAFGFDDQGVPYIVMEYIEGTSLAEILKRDTRLSRERALPIFEQILDALAHAHDNGIIHRDLKPSNVMLVNAEQSVKLVDFGIAKLLPESGKEMQKLTQTGALFGTVAYMSPEHCRSELLDCRSDIYSMGCLMFEVLDGNPPIQGDTPFSVIAKHLADSPRKSEYVTGELGEVIFSALQKDPADRPRSAKYLKSALIDPSIARASGFLGKPRRKTKKARVAIAAGGAVLCLGVAVFLLAYPNPPRRSQSSKGPSDEPGHIARLHQLEADLKEAEKVYGFDSPEIAMYLDNLGEQYWGYGEGDKAVPVEQRLLAIRLKTLGPNHPLVIGTTEVLANCYIGTQQWSKAQPMLLHVLAVKEKNFGPDSAHLLIDTNGLANCYQGLGDLDKAVMMWKRSLAIANEEYGPNALMTCNCMFSLAECYEKEGKWAQAEMLYRRALAIRQKVSPSEFDLIGVIFTRLACCCRHLGKSPEADQLDERARDMFDRARR